MPTFEDGLTERFSAASSGAAMDLQINADGTSNYIPKDWVDIAPEDQTNPFAIQGEVTPRSVPEFAGDVAAGAGGVVTGAASVLKGTPGDLVGLLKGIGQAATAEDGQRIDAFLTALAAESESWGSEFFVQKYGELAEELLPPEYIEPFKGASTYVGEMAEIPGAIAGFAKVFNKARQIPGPSGPISRQVPTQPKIDVEATPVDTKLIYETLPQRTNLADMDPAARQALESDLKTSQLDIGGSAKELIAAAKVNQKALAETGKATSKELNIEFKDPGVKGAKDKGKRLAEKAAEKGGIQQLTDITRSGFAVRTTDDADAVVQALEGQYKIIDEGYNVTPLGYFDRKIMVVNKDGQVGEVQIWPTSMYDAKIEQGGQDLYTLWRGKRLEEMSAAEKTKTRKLAKKYGIEYDSTEELRGAAKEKSIELYGEALTKLDPSMRGIVRENLQKMIEDGGADSELAMQMLDMMTTPKSKGAQ